ncbi:MAG: c-type cytochrome [Candidatus Poseidoniia archaeon]|jgi:cytochrome c|nr:c-type cytochrome [Candidatus Poseidoniia archaeon]|tara:strand:- start:924 stop:1322 length:399 start_codon:yes stop_codon:yes gene_type:complete
MQDDNTTQDERVINNTSQDMQTIKAENIKGNLDRGRKLYLQCRACHSLKQNESHKVGPNLFGIFNQRAGTQEDFTYSPSLVSSNLVWDQDNLDRWLEAPYELVPGNKMVFSGMNKSLDRTDLIAYLINETAQ